jgi:hypothetical protein
MRNCQRLSVTMTACSRNAYPRPTASTASGATTSLRRDSPPGRILRYNLVLPVRPVLPGQPRASTRTSSSMITTTQRHSRLIRSQHNKRNTAPTTGEVPLLRLLATSTLRNRCLNTREAGPRHRPPSSTASRVTLRMRHPKRQLRHTSPHRHRTTRSGPPRPPTPAHLSTLTRKPSNKPSRLLFPRQTRPCHPTQTSLNRCIRTSRRSLRHQHQSQLNHLSRHKHTRHQGSPSNRTGNIRPPNRRNSRQSGKPLPALRMLATAKRHSLRRHTMLRSSRLWRRV